MRKSGLILALFLAATIASFVVPKVAAAPVPQCQGFNPRFLGWGIGSQPGDGTSMVWSSSEERSVMKLYQHFAGHDIWGTITYYQIDNPKPKVLDIYGGMYETTARLFTKIPGIPEEVRQEWTAYTLELTDDGRLAGVAEEFKNANWMVVSTGSTKRTWTTSFSLGPRSGPIHYCGPPAPVAPPPPAQNNTCNILGDWGILSSQNGVQTIGRTGGLSITEQSTNGQFQGTLTDRTGEVLYTQVRGTIRHYGAAATEFNHWEVNSTAYRPDGAEYLKLAMNASTRCSEGMHGFWFKPNGAKGALSFVRP